MHALLSKLLINLGLFPLHLRISLALTLFHITNYVIKRMVSRLIMVQQIALRREANFTTSEADTDEGMATVKAVS